MVMDKRFLAAYRIAKTLYKDGQIQYASTIICLSAPYVLFVYFSLLQFNNLSAKVVYYSFVSNMIIETILSSCIHNICTQIYL